MNRALVRYCVRRNPNVGSARNMQIGCGGHVTNLVAQTITSTLGLAPPIAEKDLYEDTRKFSLVYDPAEDPVVVAETEEMEKDAKDGRLETDINDPDLSDSDISESDEDDHENLWVDEVEVEAETADVEELEPEMEPESVSTAKGAKGKGKGKGKKGKKTKPNKVFTPVDKIHASVVHILQSEIRRKKARVLIHKLVDKEYRHLVFVRSMVIR
ncbi:hypothetical protein B0H13DRAFT_465884 [Mycena leptocephala]|nr:hypothetical protein B0H13DRAFT_465884 [Mycena leptocephala]